jgi:hypothetical protein
MAAKKPIMKAVAKPKVSRGSNTPKQVGNDNQREAYNAQRDVKIKRNSKGQIDGDKLPMFKVTKELAKNQGFDMAEMRKRQRAGGKGK